MKGVAERSMECREASIDREAGVVFRLKTKRSAGPVIDFTAAVAASAQGGPRATSEKNKRRHTLILQLRKLALYVEGSSNDDVTTVLSSGFKPVIHSRTRRALEKPVIAGIDSQNSGQLVVKVNAVHAAKSYEVQYASVGTGGTPGPSQKLGGFTNSRSMPITGLTPGMTYMVQVRAGGGVPRTLLLVCSIHQHKPRSAFTVLECEDADAKAAKGRTNQKDRRAFLFRSSS